MARPYIPSEREEEALPEDAVLGSFDEENANTVAPEPETPVESEVYEEELPDKYKGKSLQDLVSMHQESEKFNGRQSAEVGDLRRSVDTLIQAQLTQPTQPLSADEAAEEVDFFEDPNAAIDRKLANHPSVRRAEAAALKMEQSTAQNQLLRKHADAQTIIQDVDFLKWVEGSPVRTRLFRSAHSEYDFEAADELISNWKERKQIAQQTVAVEKKERTQQVRAASTGSSPASSSRAPRKMYRRADIIRLMRDEPDRYRDLNDEIMAAYAEGRVIS